MGNGVAELIEFAAGRGFNPDLCVNDPGREVDVYFTSSVKPMADIWMGQNSYRKAIGEGALTVVGNKALTRNITAWMANSIFADLPPANEI